MILTEKYPQIVSPQPDLSTDDCRKTTVFVAYVESEQRPKHVASGEDEMDYEVEMKFPVQDIAALESEISRLGGVLSQPHQEIDLYFAHPSRDFRQTDEALRIRRKGKANFVTYKGPKIDAVTKTRQEIELPLSEGDSAADHWADLFQSLGFVPVREVAKSRRKAFVDWQGHRVEMSLDYVAELGTFVELELVIAKEEFEPAKQCIITLAKHLGLKASERRSYLELLESPR